MDRNAFLTSSGEGRGAAAAEDGRRVLNSKQCAKLRAFISAKHENGKQVFRRTVGESIKQECNVDLSNRAAEEGSKSPPSTRRGRPEFAGFS